MNRNVLEALALVFLFLQAKNVSAQELRIEVDQERSIFVHEITLEADEYFAFDSAELTPDDAESVKSLAQALSGLPSVKILVVGHTDRIGSDAYNLRLSKERARSVAEALAEMSGVPEASMAVAGVGKADPVVACEGVKGDAAISCLAPNRRVEVHIGAAELIEHELITESKELMDGSRDLVEIVGVERTMVEPLD